MAAVERTPQDEADIAEANRDVREARRSITLAYSIGLILVGAITYSVTDMRGSVHEGVLAGLVAALLLACTVMLVNAILLGLAKHRRDILEHD